MKLRNITYELSINNQNFEGDFYVSHALNHPYKLAVATINSKSNINVGDTCVIKIEEAGNEQTLINGTIFDILNDKKRITVHVKESILEDKPIKETFSDYSLQNTCKHLGKINVFVHNTTKIFQVTLTGDKEENFLRLISDYSKLMKTTLYYSIRNDSGYSILDVREEAASTRSKNFHIQTYKSFKRNTLICIPIVGLQVGDNVSILGQNKIVTALKTSVKNQEITFRNIL